MGQCLMFCLPSTAVNPLASCVRAISFLKETIHKTCLEAMVSNCILTWLVVKPYVRKQWTCPSMMDDGKAAIVFLNGLKGASQV